MVSPVICFSTFISIFVSQPFLYPINFFLFLSDVFSNIFNSKAMKGSALVALFFILLLHELVPSAVLSARHITKQICRHGYQCQSLQPSNDKEAGMLVKPNIYGGDRVRTKQRGDDTGQIAGSSLPDCSHACGWCSPCRLVMVRFVCASLQEAETCPLSYRCMCNRKSYPVP